MNIDLDWFLSVLASAAILGACLWIFQYLTKRVLGIEIPPSRRSLMIFALVFVSTTTGASHDVRFAAILFPAVVSAWFFGYWANQWLDSNSDKMTRFVETVSSGIASDVTPPFQPDARRRWFTILVPTVREALQCPACGGQAMTATLKANIGPAKSRACDSCGEHVSPSWNFFFVLLVVVFSGVVITLWMAIPAGGGAANVTTAVAGLLVTSAVFVALAFRFALRAPLVRRRGHPHKLV